MSADWTTCRVVRDRAGWLSLARLLPAADLADPPNTEEPERTTP